MGRVQVVTQQAGLLKAGNILKIFIRQISKPFSLTNKRRIH